MSLIGVMSDLHLPFENKRKINLALDVFEDQGIDHLVLNGDVADFYCINAHGPKHPGVRTRLDDEFIALEDFFSDLRKRFPKLKVTFIFGNHEHRLERYVIANCPAFYNHLTIENLVKLHDYDIDVIPYNERFKVADGLFIQHSPPSYSVNAAATSLKKKIDEDHIWGCTHRPDDKYLVGSSGKVYTSYMLGWFGDKGIFNELQNEMPDNKRVFSFTKNHETWGTSFALVAITELNHHVNHIIVKETGEVYECVIGDTVYQG